MVTVGRYLVQGLVTGPASPTSASGALRELWLDVDSGGVIQIERLEIDDVDVGPLAHLQGATVVEANDLGGVLGLHLDRR